MTTELAVRAERCDIIEDFPLGNAYRTIIHCSAILTLGGSTHGQDVPAPIFLPMKPSTNSTLGSSTR